MKQGLVVIDVQNDYFSGGSMELVGIDEAALNCNQLLNAFRQKNAPVFHIQHVATREGATFFVPNTVGCEIHESVRPLDNEIVVIKHYPSSFRETELNETLKNAGVDELTICGAMTHMCIDTTTRAAFDLGYKCNVISDACATRDLEFNGQSVKAAEVQAAFMAALSVPFADISSTEKYLSIVK
ncbi:cysteine hydrolase family protein [Vibrio sp. 99-70-13A1]|uniref:cysteine hydrolase family protein n=1 Tax=Vibrio sp. 99-70-13A1 TaxID=2607601 RepID=UPI001493632D|nr:cysteine hydrolase family protein [Vibrio sp. 99-70-13A1]NOH99353.1 cysteine hydrolase [Vibrio sp. 99-70-13A1]